jgi:hypothetical protein
MLILCEGETERNYFQALKEDPEYKVRLSAVLPLVAVSRNSSPQLMVREALRRRSRAIQEGNPFEQIWLIFDHDHHPNRRNAYEEAIREQIHVGFSAISFEVWYLLHRVRSTRAYLSSDAAIKELQRYYPGYEKARQNDFALLKPYMQQAFAHAQWLRDQTAAHGVHCTDQPHWTDVDVLVRQLIRL